MHFSFLHGACQHSTTTWLQRVRASSRFPFFVVFWCFLAFLPRITLLCLFQKKKPNLLNVWNGIWNICSMILYIYIFKSIDTPSQILYRGPLLCCLFYFCETVFSCWECSQKLSQSHKMQERSEEGGNAVFWKGSLITIISATRLSVHSSLPSLSFLPPPSLLSSIFVSCLIVWCLFCSAEYPLLLMFNLQLHIPRHMG